jgi:hypothetical protein
MSKKSKKSGAEGKSTNLPETNSVDLHFSLAGKTGKGDAHLQGIQ